MSGVGRLTARISNGTSIRRKSETTEESSFCVTLKRKKEHDVGDDRRKETLVEDGSALYVRRGEDADADVVEKRTRNVGIQ